MLHIISLTDYASGGNAKVLTLCGVEIYFSYATPIAVRLFDRIVATKKFYSHTTSKHRNQIRTRTEVDDAEFQEYLIRALQEAARRLLECEEVM